MRFETVVIARRFSIICLMSMIFGFAFAAMVEGASRPARAWELGQVQSCSLKNGISCALVK